MRRLLVAILLVLIVGTCCPLPAANEIQFQYETSNSVYAIIRKPSTNQVWDITNTQWTTWNDLNIGDYDLPLTDHGGDFLSASFPAGITDAGDFPVTLYEQDGASPATDDLMVGHGSVLWDGTAEVTLSDVRSVTTKLDDTLEDDNGTYRFTSNALEEAPSSMGAGLTALLTGTAQAGTASSITLAAGASSTDNYYQGALVILTGGTGADQFGLIRSYVGSTKVATIYGTWATNPSSDTTYELWPTPWSLLRVLEHLW